MKKLRAPITAASTIVLLAGIQLAGTWPALSQGLPPTNMGKWVHTPGDNQYGNQAQTERHAVPVAPPSQNVQYSQQNSGWSPTPPPRMADVSIEPIPADEPVAPAGFPPLPDRFDLGVSMGWGASGAGAGRGWGGSGGAGGGNGGGGGGAPPSGPQFEGSHQHYSHYQPGSYGQSASHGYYRATTPTPPTNPAAQGGPKGDVYQTNGGGGGGAPAGGPNYGAQMRGLGREPKLNEHDEKSATPDAPQAVPINQATTQDLSLPEDEFQYQKPVNQNTTGKRVMKRVGRVLLRPVNSVGSYAGIRF